MKLRTRTTHRIAGFALFLLPIFVLHFQISKERQARLQRVNPSVVRWTAWEPSDAQPQECSNAWQEQPDAEAFRALLTGTEHGALVLPWLDTSKFVTGPGKNLCGWVAIKGERGRFTVQGRPFSRVDAAAADSEDMIRNPAHLDFPPDGVSVRAIGTENGFERLIEVSDKFIAFEHELIEYRLYHTSVTLLDPDTYKLKVLLEYRGLDHLGDLMDAGRTPPISLPTIVSKDAKTLLDSVKVTGKRIDRSTYLGLPKCTGAGHVGRWVNATWLKKPLIASSWTSEEEAVREDLAEPLESYDGQVWVPYECRYQRWTYGAFRERCLTKWHKVTHWIGDSNLQRALKALTTGGAWCREWYDESSSECQCQGKELSVPHISNEVPSWSIIPYLPAYKNGNATFLLGLTESLQPNHYKSWSWKDIRDLAPGNTPATNLDTPTMVIINLPHSDTLPLSRPLPELLDSFQALIPHLHTKYAIRGIPIVIRTPQFSPTLARARTKIISRYFVDVLVAGLRPTTAVHVWDVHQMSEQASASARKRLAQCSLGHASRDFVDLENQALMNLMCNQQLAEEKAQHI
ncbi:hypothetical protein HDU87_002656 [Geranomyces variabilis]|uniref:Uncharacterized protein n=1 Tax=Geranomyces variabilis TaxID=109894 RepID=A0AAD5XTW6_9FUNG|nr:hypothetical protein HDU87_002656 [Geranomyces variabilis]